MSFYRSKLLKFNVKIKGNRIYYVLYAVAVALVFLYILFPSTALKMVLTDRLNQIHPNIHVTIAKLEPVLPPGVKLYNVDIFYRDAALLNLDTVKATPGLLSLFGSRTILKFKSRAYAGWIDGRAEFNRHSRPGGATVDGRISGIELQRIAALNRLAAHNISGLLAGEFTYSGTGRNGSLSAHLSLADSRVELAAALFGQEFFEFKDVDASLVLKNGALAVQKCRLKGNQLDAEISGTIGLRGSRGQNPLNFTGSVTPHHVFMAQIENSIPAGFLKGANAGRRAIGFKIGGTLNDPGLSLN